MINYENREWLEKKYNNEKLSPYKIGRLCNCAHTTIYHWLKKLNIHLRSRGEANHLRQANHCNLSEKAKQWIDGDLLSDGHLQSSKYSARFMYGSRYKQYVNYMSNMLDSFGIKQSGRIIREIDKKRGNISYKYTSLTYVELLPIHKRWYPNGRKIVPKDIKLTPLVCRQELIGDGSLIHSKGKRPYIELATCAFSAFDTNWLVEQLNRLGFKSTRMPSKNRVRISSHSTRDFLDYIGNSPVKCYDYKFAY